MKVGFSEGADEVIKKISEGTDKVTGKDDMLGSFCNIPSPEKMSSSTPDDPFKK